MPPSIDEYVTAEDTEFELTKQNVLESIECRECTARIPFEEMNTIDPRYAVDRLRVYPMGASREGVLKVFCGHDCKNSFLEEHGGSVFVETRQAGLDRYS